MFGKISEFLNGVVWCLIVLSDVWAFWQCHICRLCFFIRWMRRMWLCDTHRRCHEALAFVIFRTGLTMSEDTTWLVCAVVHEQIGMNTHNEEQIRDIWVFFAIFGPFLVMLLMKNGITMNFFQNLIKFEYSNIFFAAQSFVGIEIESFLATFVGNRYDNVSSIGLGVYIEIDLCLFACFGLSLYACRKYVVIQCLIWLLTNKSILIQIDIYVIQSFILSVEYIKRSCIVLYHIVQSLIWYIHMSQLYLPPFPETFLASRTCTELIIVLFQCFFRQVS